MGAERLLVVIPQGYKKKQAGEERYDDDAYRCPGQQLEVKMFLTEEPGKAAA
jgi:hypothetical protein